MRKPWIHVRTLGQFEYCPNAGIIAFCRQGDNEAVEEDRIPNLGYLPPLDHALHLELTEELRGKLKEQLLAFLGMLLFVLLVGQFASPALSFLLLLATLPLVAKIVWDSLQFYQAWTKLRDYERQPPIVLPESGSEVLPIHWWSLVKSDYAPIMPKGSYSDDERAFSGRPWRLMEHRDSRRLLPVIKRLGTETELKVRSSHRVRLAAYALLLEMDGQTVADWGILIDSKTLAGFAVPIRRVDRERALRLLSQIQTLIIDARGNYGMQEPPGNVCRGCWLGQPRRFVPGVSETNFRGKRLPAYLGRRPYFGEIIQIENVSDVHNGDEAEDEQEDDYDDYDQDEVSWEEGEGGGRFRRDPNERYRRIRVLHSDCGDIFSWRPPHQAWESERNA